MGDKTMDFHCSGVVLRTTGNVSTIIPVKSGGVGDQHLVRRIDLPEWVYHNFAGRTVRVYVHVQLGDEGGP